MIKFRSQFEPKISICNVGEMYEMQGQPSNIKTYVFCLELPFLHPKGYIIYHCLFTLVLKSPNGLSGQLSKQLHLHTLCTLPCIASVPVQCKQNSGHADFFPIQATRKMGRELKGRWGRGRGKEVPEFRSRRTGTLAAQALCAS